MSSTKVDSGAFAIDDGPKAKVKEIVFDGNHVFSDAKLRAVMKNVKQPGFWNLSWLGGKTTYTETKWLGGGDEKDQRDDHGRLEDFYLNHGYVTARIGQPKISYRDKPGASKKKPVKLMTLEIPVTEGEQYKMGELKFEGLTVLKEPFVRSYFKLKPGDVYNDGKFKKAYDKLRDLYGMLGYFQWTGSTQRKPDPQRKVVDVTVKMEEDKQYFVGRINFTGNDSTRDKVIRREIYMNEGEVFNTEALKMSIKRINQLGYFKQMEGAPDIRPSEMADNKVDVTFKVEEQNRNQFTFGAGVSGLEGTFINGSFSTSNFLGAGETLSLSAQTGARTKNYQLALTEPGNYLRVFLDSGKPMRELLLVYLQTSAPSHKAYAQKLLDEFHGISEDIIPDRAQPDLVEPLTPRELEVLRLLTAGCSNRQIAEKLVLAEGTVKFHVHAVLEKLNVHSRTQAIAKARELNLI